MKILISILLVLLVSCAGTKNNDELTLKDIFNKGMSNLEKINISKHNLILKEF